MFWNAPNSYNPYNFSCYHTLVAKCKRIPGHRDIYGQEEEVQLTGRSSLMKASQVDDAIFSTYLAKKAWVPHKRTNTLLNNNKKKYMRDIVGFEQAISCWNILSWKLMATALGENIHILHGVAFNWVSLSKLREKFQIGFASRLQYILIDSSELSQLKTIDHCP